MYYFASNECLLVIVSLPLLVPPSTSSDPSLKKKIKTASLSYEASQGSPRDQAWSLYNSSASSMTPGIARGHPSDLQQHEAPWNRRRQTLSDRLSASACREAARESSAWEEVGQRSCKSAAFLASSYNHCTHPLLISVIRITYVYRSVNFCLHYRNHVCVREKAGGIGFGWCFMSATEMHGAGKN